MLLITLVFLIAACGDKKDSRESKAEPERAQDNLCTETNKGLCVPNVDWTIDSSSVNFPQKFSLSINEAIKLDICATRNAVAKTVENGRTKLGLKLPWFPKETFKVTIIDRGTDCTNDALFYEEENVHYGTGIIEMGTQKFYSVEVQLQN